MSVNRFWRLNPPKYPLWREARSAKYPSEMRVKLRVIMGGPVFSHFSWTYNGSCSLDAFLDADYDERFGIANFEIIKTATADQRLQSYLFQCLCPPRLNYTSISLKSILVW